MCFLSLFFLFGTVYIGRCFDLPASTLPKRDYWQLSFNKILSICQIFMCLFNIVHYLLNIESKAVYFELSYKSKTVNLQVLISFQPQKLCAIIRYPGFIRLLILVSYNSVLEKFIYLIE